MRKNIHFHLVETITMQRGINQRQFQVEVPGLLGHPPKHHLTEHIQSIHEYTSTKKSQTQLKSAGDVVKFERRRIALSHNSFALVLSANDCSLLLKKVLMSQGESKTHWEQLQWLRLERIFKVPMLIPFEYINGEQSSERTSLFPSLANRR